MKTSYESIISFNEKENMQLKNSIDLKVSDAVVMKQKLTTNDIALRELKEELNGYKKLNSYLKTEVTTTIKNLEAKYNDLSKDQFDGVEIKDGSYIHVDEVDKHFLRVPKTFTTSSEWFTVHGTVKKQFTVIDSLSMFNKFDAIIGYKKPNKKFKLFRKKEPVVELKSYNPYTKINYVNNVVVSNNKTKVESIFLSRPAMLIYGFLGGKLIN